MSNFKIKKLNRDVFEKISDYKRRTITEDEIKELELPIITMSDITSVEKSIKELSEILDNKKDKNEKE